MLLDGECEWDDDLPQQLRFHSQKTTSEMNKFSFCNVSTLRSIL